MASAGCTMRAAAVASTRLRLTSYSSLFLQPYVSSRSFPSRVSPSVRRPLVMSAAPPQSSSPPQPVAAGGIGGEENVLMLIKTHQENAARLPPVEEIRTVLSHSVRGMLSTFSQKYDGYPSGSMLDFASDVDGSIILAVSSLSVHCKDLSANPKCSLLVARDPEDRNDLVITVHGDAIPVTSFTPMVSNQDTATTRTAYLAKHPNAFWVDFGDFQLLRIEPKVVRYVSGVATALLQSGEFTKDEFQSAKVDPISQFAKPITSHMNRDHGEDTKLIVKHSTSIPGRNWK
ncbi:hypothetical protein LINGRAHAP2_LOCUS27923 [Linum grandiflorum]